MAFYELLKAARESSPFTQCELAMRVGVSQSNFSKYENGLRPIPDDIAIATIEALKNPRLKVEYSLDKKAELLNIPLLNNVDENVVTVIDALIEESEELLVNARALKKLVRNKKSSEDFTLSEWDVVMKCEEQIADVIPALKLHFITMAEKFNLDPNRLALILKAKFKRKKYLL